MSGKKNHIHKKSIDPLLIYFSELSNLELGSKTTGWLHAVKNKNTNPFLIICLLKKSAFEEFL